MSVRRNARVARSALTRGGSVYPTRMACLALPLSLAGLLTGCRALLPTAAPTGSTFDVGNNGAGAACTLISRPAPEKIAEAGASYYNLQCGGWEHASGSVFVVAAAKASPSQLVAGGWWRIRSDQFLTCATPRESTILNGVHALALDCKMTAGSWPYQAVVAQIGDQVYLADGIPNAYAPLERSIGVLSGRAAVTATTANKSEEMLRLQNKFAGAQFDIGDVTQYTDLLRLAHYHNARGEHAQAEINYRKALDVAMKEHREQEAFLSMHVALELSNQQKFEAADAMFKRADAALVSSKTKSADEARLLAYQSIHLGNQRKNEQAMKTAERATRMFSGTGHGGFTGSYDFTAGQEFTGKSGLMRATTGFNLVSGAELAFQGNAIMTLYLEASLQLQDGRYGPAEATLNKARDAFAADEEAPRRWAVELDVLGASIAERQGHLGQAKGLLNRAIATEKSLLGDSRTGGAAYLALGRVQAAQDHRGAALKAFRQGFEIISRQGGSIEVTQVFPYFTMGLQEVKEGPAGFDGVAAEMFEISQLISSPVVNQSIAQVTARLQSGNAEVGGVIRKLQDAKIAREALRQESDLTKGAGGGSRAAADEQDRRYAELNNRINELELQVQAASPRYNQLVTTKPVTAKEVGASLAKDEALSVILIGPEGGIGFLVEPDAITAYPIALGQRESQRFVKDLRAPMEDPADLPAYPVPRAHDLYQRLYGPVDARLAGKRHLIHVPSGALMSLPFALLVTAPSPAVTDLNYAAVPWMVKRQALTLAPSVQSYLNLRKAVAASTASQPFLGFGDPIPNGNGAALMAALEMPAGCQEQANLIANAQRLPDTAFELRESAKILHAGGDSVVLGPAFTESAVKRKDLANYRIVSFATHGLLPSKLQCLPEPALLTTPSGPGGDGLLMSSEVADLKMNAELVVLSACDTGGGSGGSSTTGGEALSGLARAFFFAGARNLLVSHWEVPSVTTTELLVRTFREMSQSGSKSAEALRTSQLSIIATGSYSHPKAWAGFTVVGHGR